MSSKHQSVQRDVEYPGSSSYSRNALKSIQQASITARDFDSAYSLRNVEREVSIPLFTGVEVVLESTTPSRMSSNGFYNEFSLQNLRVTRELVDASDPAAVYAHKRRQRVADRLLEQPGSYSVKYCRRGLLETDHGPQAAAELVLETKILMNLSPSHPNLLQIFAANGDGIDSFLESGRTGFFLLVDRLSVTLDQRLEVWKGQQKEHKRLDAGTGSTRSYDGDLTERLEVANDICSALVFLASRELVYYLRPGKVGFDTRSGRLKLCEFGEARQEGLSCHSPTILDATSSDILAYTAPEVLGRHSAPATVNVDVYAFGIVLWELTTLERPFDGYSKKEHFNRVVKRHERPNMLTRSSWPREIPRLMEQCWDPHFRPTIKTVQEILETVLLFDEADEGKHNTSEASPRKESVVAAPSDLTPQTPHKSSSVDQHLRRSVKEAHSPRDSGASVATHNTYKTRGDYSAFTNGTVSARHNQVQQQRMTRQRSVSRGPVTTQRRRSSAGGNAFDEASSVCKGLTVGRPADQGPRQRRSSVEVPRAKSRLQLVQRSRSMTGEDASVIGNALSLEPTGNTIKDKATQDRPSPMEIDDSTSKDTTPTLPSSESSPDPPIVSPGHRHLRSPRGSSFHVSPVSTPTSDDSSTSVSPKPQAGGPDSALRNARVPRRASRTQSLRILVRGEDYPVKEEFVPRQVTDSSGRCVHRTPRRNSAGAVKRSSFSSAISSPNTAFSLDNISQAPSPELAPQRTIPRRNSAAPHRNRSQLSGVSRCRSNDTLQGMQVNSKQPRLVSDPNQVAMASAAASMAPPPPRRRAVQRSASSRDMPKVWGSPRRPSLLGDSSGDRRSTLTRSDSSTFRAAGGAAAARQGGRAPLGRGESFSGRHATAPVAPRRRPSCSGATARTELGSHSPLRGGPVPRTESFSAKLRAEMAEEMQLLHRRQGETSPHRASHGKAARRSSKQ